MTTSVVPIAKSVMIVTALASALWVSAGSLTPPPGPITSTMKDLDDVEPRIAIRNDFDTITPIVITDSGSYYLAEDIYAIHTQHGIEITASNVTLDLNGFTVYGNLEVGSLSGIKVTGNRTEITVRNGKVRDFFDDGLAFLTASKCRIENVHVSNNGQRGINLGANSIVKGCVATGNSQIGINTGQGSVISESLASENAQQGFFAGGSVITNCVARNNTGDGISGSIVERCKSHDNGGNGILVSSGEVTHCLAHNNGASGIRAITSYVYGNQCTDNTEAGIFLTGQGSRVDSNNMYLNDIGIDASGGGNVVIRNTAKLNPGGNYDLPAGTEVGPIGTAAGSTSPWANISY